MTKAGCATCLHTRNDSISPPPHLSANHKTTAMLLLGGLWPVFFMGFTRYSNWTARGWSFNEAFVYDMSTNPDTSGLRWCWKKYKIIDC